jgi:hypothetical protein
MLGSKTRLALGYGKELRVDGVRIKNFHAAACAGILNTLAAGPCRIIPQQEEVSIGPSSPGSNTAEFCRYG